MEEMCELCRRGTGQHRNFFRLVKYRNDQRDQTRECGVFCNECAARILKAFEETLRALEEARHG